MAHGGHPLDVAVIGFRTTSAHNRWLWGRSALCLLLARALLRVLLAVRALLRVLLAGFITGDL
jgi:hypothetical protein